MAFADTQQLVVQLDLKGNLSSGIRNAQRSLKGFDQATSRTQRSLGKFGSNLTKTVAVGLTATAGGFLAVVNAAKDYESAFAGVRKTVTATDAQLSELSDQFRALAKEIPISAAELARLGEAGGALGVPTDQLKEFVRVTALLGVTTNLTADEAADSLGVLGNVLHLTGEEYSKFASSLVALGNAGASTERDIVAIAERSGAAGELIGLATEQVLGFASATASLGIEAEAGGTALQKFFIDSAKFVAEGGDELKIFAKVTGKTTKAFAQSFKKDAGKALQEFLKDLGRLSQAKQLAVLEDLGFNDARITRTLLGLANNTKLVSDQMGVANQAFKENTALTKEAQQRFNTFDSQLQLTKNILTDVAITIGSKLLPKITPLLKRLNEFVNTHQGDIEKFGDNLADAFGKFADAIGKVDWRPFIDGLKLSAQLAKSAFDVFNSLPDDFKKLILVGAGINKVTGGLLTSVSADIGGALFNKLASGSIFGKGQTPANPLWVATVSGGLPGGPIPTGGTGGGGGGGVVSAAKGALSLVGKVLIVGIAAEAAATIAGTTRDSQNRLIASNGNIVRQVADQTQQLTNLQNAALVLQQRANAGDAFAAQQLVAVKAQMAALQGTLVAQHDTERRAVASSERQEAIAMQQTAQQSADAARLLGSSQALNATARSQLGGVISQVGQLRSTTSTGDAAIRAAVARAESASRAAGQQAAFAIKNKDLSVTLYNTVNTRVSVRDQVVKTSYTNKYGLAAS